MNVTGTLPTSNRKFEAKLEGQSHSFHAGEERSISQSWHKHAFLDLQIRVSGRQIWLQEKDGQFIWSWRSSYINFNGSHRNIKIGTLSVHVCVVTIVSHCQLWITSIVSHFLWCISSSYIHSRIYNVYHRTGTCFPLSLTGPLVPSP